MTIQIDDVVDFDNHHFPNPESSFKGIKSAQFFRLHKPLSVAVLEGSLKELLTNAHGTLSAFHFASGKRDNLVWALSTFFYKRDVCFFTKQFIMEHPTVCEKESIGAYILIIWRDPDATINEGQVAVFKSNTSLPKDISAKFFSHEPIERFYAIFGNEDLAFQHIALSNTLGTRYGVANRSYDGGDLRQYLSTVAGKRLLPRQMQLRRDQKRVSIIPGSSRLAQQSSRFKLGDLLTWTLSMFEGIQLARDPAPFLASFARPCGLSDLPSSVEPRYFSIDICELEKRCMGEDGNCKLMKFGRDASDVDWENLHDLFSESFTLDASTYDLLYKEDLPVGKIRRTAKGFYCSISSLRNYSVIENGSSQSLNRFIVKYGLSLVMFNDPRYAMVGNQLVLSDDIKIEVDYILRHVESVAALSGTKHEKHAKNTALALTDQSTQFPIETVFHVIESDIVASGHLFCDDQGDEWADYICVDPSAERATITFYHAKQLSGHGASDFQEVVAQSLKNLGRVRMSHEQFARSKKDKSVEYYKLDSVNTKIRRVRRPVGDFLGFVNTVKSVNESYDPERCVALVIGGISKASLQEKLDGTTKSGDSYKEAVQLFWLLNVFIGTCLDAGVRPRIICG